MNRYLPTSYNGKVAYREGCWPAIMAGNTTPGGREKVDPCRLLIYRTMIGGVAGVAVSAVELDFLPSIVNVLLLLMTFISIIKIIHLLTSPWPFSTTGTPSMLAPSPWSSVSSFAPARLPLRVEVRLLSRRSMVSFYIAIWVYRLTSWHIDRYVHGCSLAFACAAVPVYVVTLYASVILPLGLLYAALTLQYTVVSCSVDSNLRASHLDRYLPTGNSIKSSCCSSRYFARCRLVILDRSGRRGANSSSLLLMSKYTTH